MAENKIRDMQMTVFQAKRLPEETFRLISPIALWPVRPIATNRQSMQCAVFGRVTREITGRALQHCYAHRTCGRTVNTEVDEL